MGEEERRAAGGGRRWGRRGGRVRVRAARRPEKAERERCGRGSSGSGGCAASGLRERPSRGERRLETLGFGPFSEEKRRDMVLGDLGFGPFSVVRAFLFSEVHLSPVFFFFFSTYMCVLATA